MRNHGPGGCGAACGAGETPTDKSIWDKSDIAFKPNSSGWGFNTQYSSGWDKIFKNGAAKKVSMASPHHYHGIHVSTSDGCMFVYSGN